MRMYGWWMTPKMNKKKFAFQPLIMTPHNTFLIQISYVSFFAGLIIGCLLAWRLL